MDSAQNDINELHATGIVKAHDQTFDLHQRVQQLESQISILSLELLGGRLVENPTPTAIADNGNFVYTYHLEKN